MSVSCDDVLECARRISSALGLRNAFNCIRDVDIKFLDEVVGCLSGEILNDMNRECANVQNIVNKLSSLINTSLSHIDTQCFSEHPKNAEEEKRLLTSMYYLLEIIEFLVDYARSSMMHSPEHVNIDKILLTDVNLHISCDKRISTDSESNVGSSVSHSGVSEHSVARSKDPVRKSPSLSSSQQSISTVMVTTDDNDLSYDFNGVNDPRLTSADFNISALRPRNSKNLARREYLRGKIRECLITNGLTFGEQCCTSKQPFEDLCSAKGLPVGKVQQSRKPCRTGFIRPCVRPLSANSTKYTGDNGSLASSTSLKDRCIAVVDRTEGSAVSLDKVLQSFPMLTLDEHDRRILRRKAMQVHPANILNSLVRRPQNPIGQQTPTWTEERHHRRLAMLLRHQQQQDRLQEKKASEATQRRLIQEARDRRYQLVRSRKYFKEFFQQFRARKLAKVTEEEQVFRQFFKQVLDTETSRQVELKKLEREDKMKREAIREKELASMEHAQRTQMEVINEELQKKCEERKVQLREEKVEIIQQKRDLRLLLEENIRELQESVLRNKDSVSFREKDACRLLKQR